MTLKKERISFKDSKQFSKLFIDYVNGTEQLKPFYSYSPKIESFKQIIADKSNEGLNREVLASVLKEQYASLTDTSLQLKNIELLLDKKTYTVCTGHQLCLFTGPMYFIYKILSTINLAEEFKKNYPDYNFVPVYWMASEDHDFAEIQSIHLFGKTVSWNNEHAKGAVGRLESFSMDTVIDELKLILGDSSNANELLELFQEAYLKHHDLAGATRFMVHQLFKEYGLLILDPDAKELKREFTLFIKDDVLNNTNHAIVQQSIDELSKLGFSAQVNPREINCFYIKDGIRERIENDGNVFSVLNTDITFTKEAIVTEIELHPNRFSPNVVLRPLYQQCILPNVAYIGGPGELAYWLEYKAMFNHHNIVFPILMPRNFALLSDEKTNQQIGKLGFIVNDFFQDVDVLNKSFVTKNASGSLDLTAEQAGISAAFDDVMTKAIAVDATLKGTVEAEMQKALNSIKNIESKIVRAEKQKQETSINQIKKIKAKFFPEDTLQERYENFAPFYIKHGKQFISIIKEELKPFDFELLILEL
jgi:bacillithiol biosynthesis cysteine-adding enzyme BshC